MPTLIRNLLHYPALLGRGLRLHILGGLDGEGWQGVLPLQWRWHGLQVRQHGGRLRVPGLHGLHGRRVPFRADVVGEEQKALRHG